MAFLTNNELLPGMHEVANVGPGPRVSLPFQLCPCDHAWLDPGAASSSSSYHCADSSSASGIKGQDSAAVRYRSEYDEGTQSGAGSSSEAERVFRQGEGAAALDDMPKGQAADTSTCVEEKEEEEESEEDIKVVVTLPSRIRASLFMDSVSASRVSSNFPRLL